MYAELSGLLFGFVKKPLESIGVYVYLLKPKTSITASTSTVDIVQYKVNCVKFIHNDK